MKYLKLDSEIYIKRYDMTNYLLCHKKKDEQHLINTVSFEIITRLDGTRTTETLIDELMELYQEKREVVKENVEEFFSVFQNAYNFKITQLDYKHKSPIEIKGTASHYPKAASLEITECCNLKCLHCYGSFGGNCHNTMELADVKKVLTDLASAGVTTLELTGGDISVHPKLKEIVEYALQLPFSQIDLLSNGVILKKEILDLAIANKNRINVQIDLHSLDDDYLYWFTQVKDTVDIIKKKIEYLSSAGVSMRVATVFTKKNLKEVQNIANWVAQRNIRWGVGVVEKLGRANESDSNLFLDTEDVIYFQKELEIANQKYPGMISIIDYRPNDNNCGAMTTHVVINSYGKIKLCTMDDGSYFKNPMGNCLNESVVNNYDKNMGLVKALTFYQLPTEENEECKGCTEQYACGHCILRHFINLKERNFECDWYKNHMPRIMKEAFFAD